MTKKNKKRSRRERVIYNAEQKMLPLKKRDCPMCMGKGYLTRKNPFWEQERPAGTNPRRVPCRCRGDKTTEGFMRMLGITESEYLSVRGDKE